MRLRYLVILIPLAVACSQPDARSPISEADAGSDLDAGASDGGGALDGGVACGDGVVTGPGLVITTSGAMQGTQTASGWAWLGVPYAKPPTRELRWKPPEPVECPAGIALASMFGPKCPQLDSNKNVIGDEDCLTLNVWAPSTATSSSRKPVMVFIHGGGDSVGSAAEQLASGEYTYAGESLSKRDVVVVTIQYRIGMLGFLAHPLLSEESERSVSGNYGLLDMIAALKWVQANITSFGGDPSQVTIFGESAGARSTCALVSSPLAAGLFHRAIIESGYCGQPAMSNRITSGETAVEKAGCSTAQNPLACLRELSAEQIVLAFPEEIAIAGGAPDRYGPGVDGYVLPENPPDRIAAGRHNHVPVIIGSNHDETSLAVPNITTCDEYEKAIKAAFLTLSTQILDHFPCATFTTPREGLVRVTTEARFICLARRDARSFMAGQTEPVFRYSFNRGLERGPAKGQGAFHGLELLYVFGSGMGSIVATNADRTLSTDVQGYWSRFARTGDPNGDGAANWPQTEANASPLLSLDTTVSAVNDPFQGDCDFFDSLFP
jgi:para-nitrobenzyl esterase